MVEVLEVEETMAKGFLAVVVSRRILLGNIFLLHPP